MLSRTCPQRIAIPPSMVISSLTSETRTGNMFHTGEPSADSGARYSCFAVTSRGLYGCAEVNIPAKGAKGSTPVTRYMVTGVRNPASRCITLQPSLRRSRSWRNRLTSFVNFCRDRERRSARSRVRVRYNFKWWRLVDTPRDYRFARPGPIVGRRDRSPGSGERAQPERRD